MNKCPHCGFLNPDDIHICLSCASSLKRRCQKCNEEVPVGSTVCKHCGASFGALIEISREHSAQTGSSQDLRERMLRELRAKMPPSMADHFNQKSREIIGQRRSVTVLSVEVAIDKDARDIDHETIFLAVNEIIHLVVDTVYRYEGTIEKYTGNGLLALFGLPINHENDPERAVRAALDIQLGIEQKHEHFIDIFHQSFQVKIGINTGSVVAGHISDQQHYEYTVVGDTIHLATQLQNAAEGGNTFVSFNTYQRSRPIIDYQSISSLKLDGVDEPVRVFQPLCIRSKPNQLRGLPGLQIPMIGRGEEFGKLIDVLEQVIKTGSSEIVLCSGEAGIGKSRLMAEFKNYLSEHPVNIVQGTCALYMRITSYRVVADILRNMMGISELDPVGEQRKKLQRHIEQLGLDRNDVLPYLMHVLGILHTDPVQEVRIKLLDPSMLLRQTHFVLRMFFIAESRRTPLVLIFDDLHWVDQSSGQFLEYLCQCLEATPLIMILVARSFEKYSFAEAIRNAADKHYRKPHEIVIDPLTQTNANLLVDQLVTEDTKNAREIKPLIIARAGGNPYYTEELVRMLIDHGGLVWQEGGWRLAPDVMSLIHEIPGTLTDIIQARLDKLPDHLNNLVFRASVLGDSFSSRLLETLVDNGIGNLSSSLSALEERDFLIHTQLNVEDGYIFKHPLLRETVYKTLLKRDVKQLHSQVAQAIEAGDYWLPGERNQVLAYHLTESTNPAKAIPYLLISAEKARQHFANDTVVQLYRQALSLMDMLAEPDAIQREKAQVGLAQALKFTGELDEAAHLLTGIVSRIPIHPKNQPSEDDVAFQIHIEALRELADIRAREGNLDYAVQLLKQGMDLLSESGRIEFPVIWRRLADRLAWVYFRQRNLDEAYNLVDLALLDTATWQTEDPITLASLYNTIGGIYWTRSRFMDAIESVEHSLEIYRNLHYQWGIAISLTNLGILHYSTEKWSQAVEYFEQADRLRREYGDDPERPVNLTNLGMVLMDLGEYPRARVNLETSREISQRLGLNIAQAHAELGLGRLSILEGRIADAKRQLQSVRALIEPLEDTNERVASYYLLLAQIGLGEDNLTSAKSAAEQALLVSKRGGITDTEVDALRVLGKIYARIEEFEQSEIYLYDSIERAHQLNDRFNEAKAHHELGFLFKNWSEQDRPRQRQRLEQAERSLDTAIRIYEALGAKSYLENAKNARMALPSLADSIPVTNGGDGSYTQMSSLRAKLHLPEGEWHLASILTAVLTPKPGTDEELIFESTAFLLPTLSGLIQESGCQVLRHQDGFTAIFGAPITHEDDPERAVETAMQIINFYHELDQQIDLPITIHLGIAMGKIVAGKVDLEPTGEFLAAGEPLQLARLLAKACPSGHAWAMQSIYNQTSFRFEYSSIQSSLLENLPESAIYQLEGLREQILPVRGLIGLKTPFIGRHKELGEMSRMSRVLDGEMGGIIWIEGEAGIGKSRLMSEFIKLLVKKKNLVLSGKCTARHSEHAFSLFSDLLMQVFDIQHTATPHQISEQIGQVLSLWSPELDETRPFFQLLLGVQPDGAHGERINSMEPEQLRRQTFVAIHRLMSAMSLNQPLVFVLDDLQWIDSISADLLLYLSHLVVSKRVLFVCAQRQSEISPIEQVLARIRSMHPEHCIHLSIHPLSVTECRQLLDEFLASANLPDSFLSLIINQSGGNPYFIEEFVRLLVEKDILRMVRGRLVASRTIQTDALAVPTSLEGLIRARVDSLDNSARQLLQIASILGHRFNQTLLGQVAEREDNRLLLSHLHSRGMISPTVEDEYWEFSHPLIEVIVYNTVLRAQRRILHQRAAVALEQHWQGNEDEHAEDLAYHFRNAEVYDRALHYLILAGERAAARHANDVAVSFFEQASELISAVPDVGDEARWRIIHQMGEVYQFVGNYDTSLAVLQSGLDLIESNLLTPAQRASIYRHMGDTAHKKGDQEQAIVYLKQALDVMGEPADAQSSIEAARIYARLGWCHYVQSDFEAAKEAVLESMRYAGNAKNLTTLAMAENYLGGILFRQGDLEQAVQHTHTAMSYWQEIGYSWGVAAALSNLGILESVSGNWQAAYNSIKRSLDLRQKMGDVEGVAITNHNLGQLVRNLGDIAQAELYYRDSLAVSKPFQMYWHAANSYAGLAQSLLYQGKIEEAQESLRESFRLAEEMNAPDLTVEAYCILAEIHLANGALVEAEESAQCAVKLATQIGISPLLVTAWRLISSSLLSQGKIQMAKQALENSAVALKNGADRIEEGRYHAQAMSIAIAQNDLEQAKLHRCSAQNVFTELGAARDLSLLEALNH